MVWSRVETVNRFLNALDVLHWSYYLFNPILPLSMYGYSLSSFKNQRKMSDRVRILCIYFHLYNPVIPIAFYGYTPESFDNFEFGKE
ncbi:hypothetical protein CEXT_496301 [Caerostris extrusa]|uniref:Uncharacterized protein n=1 Tax=Caerostris extrusa TaxID=172846 RepID=A0AAV4VIL5_CAEEX|nr:hypothetical protein CEXT_496301 [Caerostris extrusa]